MRIILVSFLLIASLFSFCIQNAVAETIDLESITDNDFSELRMTHAAPVQAVIDPLRIRLDDGTTILLSSIEIPGYTPYDAGPYALAAKTMLEERTNGRQVRIYQTKDKNKGHSSRLGELIAHVQTKQDNIWLQGLLIQNGLARVRPSAENPEMALAMLALENEAREHKRGLWEQDEYTPLPPDNAGQAMNSWAIVEGRVSKVGVVKNKIYLNFGDDWRKDFTIGISSNIRKKMAYAELNPLDLNNKFIRIHGWVEEYNGPYINLLHHVWLEILPEETMLKPENNR